MSAAAGHRVKFVILAAWVAITVLAVPLAGRLSTAENNDQTSFLPSGAESTRALLESERFPAGDVAAP